MSAGNLMSLGLLDDLLNDDVTIYWNVIADDINSAGTWANLGRENYWTFDVYVQELPNAFTLLNPIIGETSF